MMMGSSCVTESFSPAKKEERRGGMVGAILSRPGVAVLATGADSCTRMVYNAAVALGAEDRFFHCALTREDYTLGTAADKIQARLREILTLPNVTAVVIYASCLDILTQTDFPGLIAELENEQGIPVKALLRGPLVTRTVKPRERLRQLLEELPSGGGEIVQKEKSFPPLMPDFSSICALLQTWDLHNYLATAGGCAGCMEALPDHGEYRLRHSRLNDVQVALGCDELLETGIAEDAAASGKGTTAIVGATALTMTGLDYQGLVYSLNNKGVNSVFLPANGFDPGPCGAAEAFLRLGKTMLKPARRQPDRVNILGYDPLVFLSQAKLAHGIEHMERRSLDCYILGSRGEEDARLASGAALNWVVSAEGLPLARYMEEQFGVPWLSGVPVGKYAMLHWRKRVNELTGRDDEDIELPEPAELRSSQPKILLIGEPMLTGSMAASLKNDLGLDRVQRYVYDPHGQLRQLYEKDFPELAYFADREALQALLQDTDAWIADPLYRESVGEVKALFVPVPEPLISGSRFAELPYEIFGKKGGAYLENALEGLLSC